MVPIVTPQEMGAIDAAAPEPVELLIERAGAAVARAAISMLGGTYGRRVVVIAGKGNNGNDGRSAARRLARRGVSVVVLDAAELPPSVPDCDLVIDAAYGTGFRGSWKGPDVGATRVLAVDIPSGVDGLTGAVGDGVLEAERTVTFAALKPGLLLPPGAASAGEVEVVDIGLDVSRARAHLVERADVAAWLPPRQRDTHKWRAAVRVIAGSPGMLGAAHLAASAAQRAGAGMVRLSSPGVDHDPLIPTEVVGESLPASGWTSLVLDELDRFGALVIGPGLGRADATAMAVRDLVGHGGRPVLIDGDGLYAMAWAPGGPRSLLDREAATILTPHDGEFRMLTGRDPGPDRFAAARELAADTGAVVLLKGAATIVAEPGGRALVSTAGDERLATAGTGDVLAGTIGALLAQGVPAFEAAAAGAWLHGTAASLGPARGLVAGDVVTHLPVVLGSLA
jgi:NAD(P)H-hydrate epimerase